MPNLEKKRANDHILPLVFRGLIPRIYIYIYTCARAAVSHRTRIAVSHRLSARTAVSHRTRIYSGFTPLENSNFDSSEFLARHSS